MRQRQLKDFLGAGHPGTLVSAFVYFTVSTVVWVMIGALGVDIAEDFQLTATEKGLFIALPILTGSLLRIPVGIAGDRIGPKKTGALGLVFTLIPLLLGWLGGNSLSSLILIGLTLGIAGASFAVALPLVSRWYSARYQGLVMGIVGSGNCGTVIVALTAPRLANLVGWHGVFGLAILPVVVTLALFCVFAKEQPQQPAHRHPANYLKVLRENDTWWFSLFYMVTFGGFVGLASFLSRSSTLAGGSRKCPDV
jgi:NNP family nitrate/nitrite transporter-like MFS transporter